MQKSVHGHVSTSAKTPCFCFCRKNTRCATHPSNCYQQSIHFLFIRINLHAYEAMAIKHWTFVGRAQLRCFNEWLSHPSDTVRFSDSQLVADTSGTTQWDEACGKTAERRTQIKLLCWAASRGSLSCLQEWGRWGGVGGFWEAELRVNSILPKTTTTANGVLPNQAALLKCKASLLQLLTNNNKKTKPS